MSGQLYTEMHPAIPRRHPLSNNLNHYRQPAPGTPPKPPMEPLKLAVDAPKPPASPPLPRQNAKVTPPSPPKVITDVYQQVELYRVGLLGEGGFARVYEVKDRRGLRSACKVVTKSSLKTKKAKTKLWAEIKIHRSLRHPNIVLFQDCFEDAENVYMTLELCHNGSLMDMLRRRKRFTEPEARFFMVQLIGACHYMHTCQVIHRDLKLGNIFLDVHMNVKVGDFGLAALIESPGERKKTICGTPNYIAPEVLFDTANGHSFEVDTWSIGVILYTLVVGRPPFQTKEVKAIYKRIRDNEYDFPPERPVSDDVRGLIQAILTTDPSARPALHEIVDDIWFTDGTVPSRIPTSAYDHVPDFSYVTRPVSQANLAALRRAAKLDGDEEGGIAVPSAPFSSASLPSTAGRMQSRSGSAAPAATATASLAQQEKEFQKAVQPGSPISALLSSARQPLMVAPSSMSREQPLLRKLQAAKAQSARALSSQSAGVSAGHGVGGLRNIEEETEKETKAEEHRRKELESQKARIVAQMAPEREERRRDEFEEQDEDQENVPPRRSERAKEKEKERERAVVGLKETAPLKLQKAPAAVSGDSGTGAKINGFEAAAQVLVAAFDARSRGEVFRDPRTDASLPDAKVFIVSWVDYCNKYGMGYALTDGSVGVHFNDSTTIVLAPDKIHFDYVYARRQGSVYVRKNHTVSDYPEELKSKVYLVKHFERYIMDRLYGEYDYTFVDTTRTKGMDFVQKYLRMKQVIVFKLSHDVIQFNFYDHSKVVLSTHGLLVTHIDKNYKLTRYTLAEIMAASLRPPVADAEQAKLHQRLVEKTRYCRDVLVTIINASQQAQDSPSAGPALALASEEPDADRMPAPLSANTIHTLTSRASKMSLR